MQHIFTLWLLFTSMHVRCIVHGPLMHGKLFTGILTKRIILISWRSLGVIVCSYTVWTELVLVFKALNPATCHPCDAGRLPKSNRPTSPGLKAIQMKTVYHVLLTSRYRWTLDLFGENPQLLSAAQSVGCCSDLLHHTKIETTRIQII